MPPAIACSAHNRTRTGERDLSGHPCSSRWPSCCWRARCWKACRYTIILTSILAPIAVSHCVAPIHFGVVFLIGDAIGFITPPYGLNLYVASGVTGIPYFRLLAYTVPYPVSLLIVWIAVALIPDISLFLLSGLGRLNHAIGTEFRREGRSGRIGSRRRCGFERLDRPQFAPDGHCRSRGACRRSGHAHASQSGPRIAETDPPPAVPDTGGRRLSATFPRRTVLFSRTTVEPCWRSMWCPRNGFAPCGWPY